MKRKLFSALLFGACLMASTSTFVSCKDYDDDIQNLQAQIDANSKAIAEIQKLIQSGSVITNVSSTANGVTVTLSNGNTFNVTNGKDGANGKDGVDGANGKDGAPGTVITLGDNGNWFIDGKDSGLAAQGPKGDQGAPGANAAVNGEWYALSADCTKLEYYKDGVKDESKSIVIADLVKNAGVVNAVLTDDYLVFNGVAGSEEPIVISLSTDITAISLWMTGEEVYDAEDVNNELTFTSVEEKENTFPAVAGTVNEDPFTFTNGFLRTTDAKMVIRVSPANATVKAENIMLMDSQGKDLSDLIECTAVEPYKKLLVRSTGNPTGLYTLTFKLKDDYDADALKAATKTKDGKILYAVAAKDGDDCLVASEWNVTLTTASSNPAWDFTVKVGDNKAKPVAEIHNRYSACEDGTNTTGIEEMVWKDANKPAVAPITEGENANADKRRAGVDDRQNMAILPVQVGQDIEIEFPETGNKLVKGFYVALDYKYALESKPSELAAWNSYSYEGVTKINADGSVAEKGTLFTGNKGTIKITNMTQGIYDVIGFRVFAVNLDGTLSDPDGRSFYVGVGEAAENVTLNVDIVATAANAESDFIPVDGVFVKGLYGTVSGVTTTPIGDYTWTKSTVTGEWTTTEDGAGAAVDPAIIGIMLYEKNDGTDAGKALNAVSDWSKVKYAKFTMNPSYTYYNGATYVQSIKVSKVVNKVQYDVKTITARITKVMPSFPAGKPVFRDAQEYAPGKFRAYMEPKPLTTEYTVANAAYKPYTLWKASAGSYDLSNGWLDTYSEFGTKDLNNVFYNLDENYVFSLGTSTDANDDEAVKVTAGTLISAGVYNYPFEIATKYIDNEKEHVVTVSYKYPGVNCYKDDNDNWIVDNGTTSPAANVYNTTSSTTYSVIYACWHHAQTWDWATVNKTYQKPELKWTSQGTTTSVEASKIIGKSSYNNDFFGLDLSKIVWTFGMLQPKTIKLVSAAGLDNPYFAPEFAHDTTNGFTIKFTQKNTQTESAPVSDHEETLVMTFIDKYKHTVTIQLPVTVKKPATA